MIIILVSCATFLLGLGSGVLIAKKKKHKLSLKKKEPRILRKGLIHVPIKWRPDHWEKYRITDVLIVLHEIERVVDQSKVIIAHVDDAPNDNVRNWAIEKIGDYIETDKVQWDEPIKYPRDVHEELDDYIKQIETDRLTDHIEQDHHEHEKLLEG